MPEQTTCNTQRTRQHDDKATPRINKIAVRKELAKSQSQTYLNSVQCTLYFSSRFLISCERLLESQLATFNPLSVHVMDGARTQPEKDSMPTARSTPNPMVSSGAEDLVAADIIEVPDGGAVAWRTVFGAWVEAVHKFPASPG
ncbi:hypothetical protein MVEN_00736600 [Mycena venus]|uniref:Uncharacterized protein n=1 Tax=Mycena venus TaxID=2733690 RepID=A0A8H7D3G1_9AGAR|nr:hypothetical protein MVEN_00736600 [Mycena venus]